MASGPRTTSLYFCKDDVAGAVEASKDSPEQKISVIQWHIWAHRGDHLDRAKRSLHKAFDNLASSNFNLGDKKRVLKSYVREDPGIDFTRISYAETTCRFTVLFIPCPRLNGFIAEIS